MPLVRPKKGEKRSEFVSRFMSSKGAKQEFRSKDQRLAIAFSKWRNKK
jgi:hypothetical protein|tara:strand:- start:3207 stop:3350 length:144 start_codon:yes stop_codon:yes gene_type:complete